MRSKKSLLASSAAGAGGNRPNDAADNDYSFEDNEREACLLAEALHGAVLNSAITKLISILTPPAPPSESAAPTRNTQKQQKRRQQQQGGGVNNTTSTSNNSSSKPPRSEKGLLVSPLATHRAITPTDDLIDDDGLPRLAGDDESDSDVDDDDSLLTLSGAMNILNQHVLQSSSSGSGTCNNTDDDSLPAPTTAQQQQQYEALYPSTPLVQLLHRFGVNARFIGEISTLSLIHISEPTRLLSISYAVFCLKKKKRKRWKTRQQNKEKESGKPKEKGID
eukprot:TRINITY_DN26791_c0_g2_i1.p1 TRINITY_DN26791_c0_g2~~TRINITY_DN26791_c0_g2_i1.p1  ORF type:complete len:278 (-),score=68.21 TRINITY_DN26791_c0_g2_i1:24-857(-)